MNDFLSESKQISEELRKILNVHGYNFQYAVLRKLETLNSRLDSSWIFEVSEFPVISNGVPIHIDFILRNRTGSAYLVAECKRVNPALGNWCFARVPYTRRESLENILVFDQFICTPPRHVATLPFTESAGKNVYYLGLELKTNLRGDGMPSSHSAINQAVAQVMRGSSGLANHLFKLGNPIFEERKTIRIIPAIFTTAHTWVTDADLGSAEISTGELQLNKVRAENVNWLWFNYNRSPDLRHELDSENSGGNLSVELEYEFTRSIAVINTEGIADFIRGFIV